MPELSPTARPKSRRKSPGFIWQAIFILLPVVLMASFGFWAILRQRRMVEQDAQARAAEIIRSLPDDFGRMAADSLTQFEGSKYNRLNDLDQRLIQLNLFTELMSGKNKAAFYERVSDPWLARDDEFSGIDSGGHAYMDNFCTPFFNSILDMGLVGGGTSK